MTLRACLGAMRSLTREPDIEVLNEDMRCPLSFFLLASDVDKYMDYTVVSASVERILIKKGVA